VTLAIVKNSAVRRDKQDVSVEEFVASMRLVRRAFSMTSKVAVKQSCVSSTLTTLAIDSQNSRNE
jgi:hypothetical protein